MANDKYRKVTAEMVGEQAMDAFEVAAEAIKAATAARSVAYDLGRANLPALPDHLEYVFIYKFGRWSVLIGEVREDSKAYKPSVPAGSLSDWIARQVGQGRTV